MAKINLVIKNGMVMQKGKLSKKHILISGQFIKRISSSLPKGRNANAFDARGMIIIPGLIDSHVHMREPGFEYKENFFSGSKAAVAGGVTTFLDMPNTNQIGRASCRERV